ncbi:5-bromo-4-chloroindolyl phosphate hydrolysis family protein [Paracoccus pacificus]|uniref:5-bromo-4-chloroindolyl phosphate hydrolysis family protein n=1 Tax=Paracoccus pacificus TaxID=1463598 RepID=A0ABW4R9X9_9RHOB
MAIRFGGKYSPDGSRRYVEVKAGPGSRPPEPPPVRDPRHRLESRTTWIMVAAAPLLIGAFFQNPTALVLNLAGFGLIAAGCLITREGLRAEAAYDARRVARRPAWPRKLLGGIVTGLGLGVGALEPGASTSWGVWGACLIGFAGVVLHYLTFGPDPMRDKGMEGIDQYQQDRARRVVDEGRAYLDQMRDAIRRAGDRALDDRVARFAATAEGLFRRVEEDPETVTAARRYLGVYLMGARDATIKFVDLYTPTRDPAARRAFEQLLDDLERNFADRTRSLIEGGRTDMDIEIEVLRDRLAREGVAASTRPPAQTPSSALSSAAAPTPAPGPTEIAAPNDGEITLPMPESRSPERR